MKNITSSVLILTASCLVLVGWFYWWQWRPANVRSFCSRVMSHTPNDHKHKSNPIIERITAVYTLPAIAPKGKAIDKSKGIYDNGSCEFCLWFSFSVLSEFKRTQVGGCGRSVNPPVQLGSRKALLLIWCYVDTGPEYVVLNRCFDRSKSDCFCLLYLGG